jgi:hypothetical protein
MSAIRPIATNSVRLGGPPLGEKRHPAPFLEALYYARNSEQAIDVSAGASKEEDMCSHLLTVTASDDLALISLTASPANSITIAAPAGVRQATDALHLDPQDMSLRW